MFGVEIKTKKERWRESGREGEREGYSNIVGERKMGEERGR